MTPLTVTECALFRSAGEGKDGRGWSEIVNVQMRYEAPWICLTGERGYVLQQNATKVAPIAKFMSCRPQMGTMLAPWTLLSGSCHSCPRSLLDDGGVACKSVSHTLTHSYTLSFSFFSLSPSFSFLPYLSLSISIYSCIHFNHNLSLSIPLSIFFELSILCVCVFVI